MRVIALIPAFNEQDRVALTVSAVSRMPSVSRIVVIDDGSTDQTARRALEAGADVTSLPDNRGKGAALDHGLAYVDAMADGPVDIVLLLDADLAESAREAEVLVSPVLNAEADMAIAGFPKPTGKAGFGLVKGLARTGIKRLGAPDFDAQAPLSGQRALNRAALEACTPFAGGFGVEVALTIRALRAGLRVIEVPTTMTHAATGRDLSGFAHRGKQFVNVAVTLMQLARESRSR